MQASAPAIPKLMNSNESAGSGWDRPARACASNPSTSILQKSGIPVFTDQSIQSGYFHVDLMIPTFTQGDGSGHSRSPGSRRQGADRGVQAVDVQPGDARLPPDRFGNQLKLPVSPPPLSEIGGTLRLGLQGDDPGAEIEECPAAAAHVSADVEAKITRPDEPAVEAAQPFSVEGLPQVNQLGSQQAEAALQIIYVPASVARFSNTRSR